QRFCDIPPKLETLVGHNWYDEIASMLVTKQQPDGHWIDHEDYFPTTCFALLFLSRARPRSAHPDLGAVNRSLRFSPPSPRVGEPVRISVTLTNTGAPIDASVQVDFYSGNPEQGGKRIDAQEVIFNANLDETTTAVNWVATEPGKYEIYIHVDSNAQISDLNRSNNIASQELTIRPKSAEAIDPTSAIREISEGVYQIGDVTVDVNKRDVVVSGEINIISDDTIIEFFAVGKLGKTHESLIMLDAEPIHIQLALLRLNMNPGMNLTVEGDPHTPEGDAVEIWVEWERSGATVRRRAEELVWNTMEGHPMQRTHWVFTGGRFIRNQFTAQLFHNIIAVYRDPDSIFNHPLPGGKDDRTYRVNTDVIPPKGTPVRVIAHQIQSQAQGRRIGETTDSQTGE
ncbi:MAG: YdjY domain-containing protein, partial [Candidatus Poribacteria bacterium]|nr:YdjY domain-containing protein [Candidatus Poribacteria bacterium]